MEQHPVPQNISSYEFRLVGDMTLKQFVELAGGLVVALIFYSSHLTWYFKWPLVFISAVLGVGLAFFPIEERPLEIWLTAFFKAIYSPTQFLWRKVPKKPSFLEERPPLQQIPKEERVTPQDRLKLTEFISTLPETRNPLDQKEEDFVNQIQNLFSLTSLPPTVRPEVKPITEEEKPGGIKVRKLHGPFVIEIEQMPLRQPPAPPYSVPQPVPLVTPAPPSPPPLRIREEKPITEARFAPGIPIPSVPSVANVLVGMVTDKEGKILENVIMEIRDPNGNPVRALKTNKLGQFRTVTPMANGVYEIELDKENYDFDIIKIELKGEIVQLIEIRAK